MISLKKLLGLRSYAEKVEEYKTLKKELAAIDQLGQEMADKFMLQKSIIEDVATLPETKRGEVFERYDEFMRGHQKEVSKACSDRSKILKSLEKLRNDEEVGKACRDIDLLDNAAQRYKEGKLMKSAYFDIIKSVTGEPVKYADVLAFNSKGQLLILHRVTDFTPNGMVCIPGGHVDPGEDFKTAALRELKEETNLDPVPEVGVKELGEFKSDEAHIKYYQVQVDDTQPVTVDATEHCFHEFIDIAQVPLKPFIFEQGKIVMEFLMQPAQKVMAMPILKALGEGRITHTAFEKAMENILNKAMDTEDAKPLMSESMDGETKTVDDNVVRGKVILPVRDPKRSIERTFKAISGCTDICVGSEIKLAKAVEVCSVNYKSDPGNNRLTEVEIEFVGDEVDMRQLLDRMKMGMLNGSMKIRTPHDEFMLANENGTDYVGDAVFVPF